MKKYILYSIGSLILIVLLILGYNDVMKRQYAFQHVQEKCYPLAALQNYKPYQDCIDKGTQ